MPQRQKLKTKSQKLTMALPERASAFFGSLVKDEYGRKLLREQNHRIHFEITDGKPFRVQVKDGKSGVKTGDLKPEGYDVNDLIHFQISSATLSRLFDGKIRFTDALIPIQQDGSDAMLLLECTLFKWSVLSWIGRMFRTAQLLRIEQL